MYTSLLFLHSLLRWLVLIALVYAVIRAYKGWKNNSVFSVFDNTLRHSTATIAHIQLSIGFILYFTSPVVKYFLSNIKENSKEPDTLFFGLIHITLMLISVVILTIGSAKAKRKQSDSEKFRTMCTWFAIALGIILIAIPWPFSPLASRPWMR